MNDHIIAITGGFGTVGRAVAAHVTAQGAKAVLIDAAPTPEGAPEALSAALALGNVDLTSEDQAEGAILTVVQRFGRLDGLVNAAGTFRFETVADGSIETWDQLYRINVRTAVNTCRSAIAPLKAQRGNIVNVGAANAVRMPAMAGFGPYTASKAAVLKLTESLAAELKHDHVRVNAVLPSIIDTEPNRTAMPDADVSRWVAPDALAEAIGFLLSPAARAITGAALPVTGRV